MNQALIDRTMHHAQLFTKATEAAGKQMLADLGGSQTDHKELILALCVHAAIILEVGRSEGVPVEALKSLARIIKNQKAGGDE